jgi:serine/threonine protein kinase
MKFELLEHIGKYQVLREIGSGATSRVYLGRDPFGERNVAIKVFKLDANLSDQNARLIKKGFLAEAGLAGKLQHPHIVEILDAASDADCSYLVMEYVPGGTLDAFCDVTALLPLGKVVEFTFKIIRALDHAFQHGVIHRDIKPGNILLSPEGDIKVSDFGASFQRHHGSETTQVSGVGSPAYMSPEQIRLEDVSHQTDIYSLGVVMYKLLTGRLPYAASNQISLAYAILNVAPRPPSTFRPDLPPLLDEIVLKAIEKDTAARYQNWIDFGKDLTQAFTSLRLAGESASDSEKFTELRGLAFFEDFDDAELWEVLRIGRWRNLASGDIIIREGDQGDSFFILINGEVNVTLMEKSINVIKPGGCFGELLYFSDRITRRTTTITALTDATVIEIKSRALNAATDAIQVEFNKTFIRVLIDRLIQANLKLAER